MQGEQFHVSAGGGCGTFDDAGSLGLRLELDAADFCDAAGQMQAEVEDGASGG
jgi:hypothetical protein